jgi:hypothetical protein
MAAINSAVDSDSEQSTLQCLLSENLDLSDIDPANTAYYHKGLQEAKKSKANGRLTEEEVQECITEMNSKAEMDRMGNVLFTRMLLAHDLA